MQQPNSPDKGWKKTGEKLAAFFLTALAVGWLKYHLGQTSPARPPVTSPHLSGLPSNSEFRIRCGLPRPVKPCLRGRRTKNSAKPPPPIGTPRYFAKPNTRIRCRNGSTKNLQVGQALPFQNSSLRLTAFQTR